MLLAGGLPAQLINCGDVIVWEGPLIVDPEVASRLADSLIKSELAYYWRSIALYSGETTRNWTPLVSSSLETFLVDCREVDEFDVGLSIDIVSVRQQEFSAFEASPLSAWLAGESTIGPVVLQHVGDMIRSDVLAPMTDRAQLESWCVALGLEFPPKFSHRSSFGRDWIEALLAEDFPMIAAG